MKHPRQEVALTDLCFIGFLDLSRLKQVKCPKYFSHDNNVYNMLDLVITKNRNTLKKNTLWFILSLYIARAITRLPRKFSYLSKKVDKHPKNEEFSDFFSLGQTVAG